MRVIGLMSGTSVDGIDAALVDISGDGYAVQVTLQKGITYPYPEALRSQILDLCADTPITLSQLTAIDDAIAHQFIQAIYALDTDLDTVDLIGSHGQTLHHRPPPVRSSAAISPAVSPTAETAAAGDPIASYPPQSSDLCPLGYTLQLGRGDLIAHTTGCATVSNFRVADIALGGQGAPLVPLIDACLLSQSDRDLAVQNIGGIGNVTYLPPWPTPRPNTAPPTNIQGWDTGPGNVLIDWAVTKLSAGKFTYDRNGEWAAQGTPCQALIAQWLTHPFFHIPPPKSTGRELFSPDYAEQCWAMAQEHQLSDADFIATLTDFTAATIELSYRQFLPQIPAETLIGGGGCHNPTLMAQLQQRLPTTQVKSTTEQYHLDADYKEAIAFAVLAYWRWHHIPGNLPSVTGAERPCLLGELWQA